MSSPVAVVIGAGALGRATAAILVGSGRTVVAVDRAQEALRELPGSIRSEVADTTDTTDPATATALVDGIAREIGPPAALVAPHMTELGSGAIVHVAARPGIEASGGTASGAILAAYGA
jgi:3-hydroxyacyl-CoA dehydrogenase